MMLELVKNKAIPGNIEDSPLRGLLSKAQFLAFNRKQVVFCEGHPALGIFCIRSGRVKVSKMGYNGRPHILHISGQGEILNAECAFGSEAFTSTGEMMEEGSIAFIERAKFVDMISADPTLALLIADLLANRITASHEERVYLAEGTMRERMARALVVLGRNYGLECDKGVLINLPLSRADFANMIGTTSGTVMRLIKEFKEDKAIRLKGKHIVIERAEFLEEVAHI